MLQVVDELPVQGRLYLFISCPASSFLCSVVFPLQVLSETVLDTSSPVPVMIFPISVVLRPVSPAFPCLRAGAGDRASQGDIRAAQMSRYVGCEWVLLGVCLS